MNDKVIKFYPKDAGDNPDNVLEQAMGQYSEVIIIGYDKDGDLDVRASSNIDQANIVYALNLFMHNLFSGEYSD